MSATIPGMWTLLGAPLDSAAAGEGEELAPAALRAAGPGRSGSAWRTAATSPGG